ncbi:MAG: hypothetical protein K2Z25_24025 [Beijerinckiaceae bacterium]|nr:hypothetical protein [Beijerinckiaceae bacterium]
MIDQEQRPVDASQSGAAGNSPSTQRPRVEPSQLNQVDDGPTVETPVEARGGFMGRPVAVVLIVSLVLTVLAGIFVGYIPL